MPLNNNKKRKLRDLLGKLNPELKGELLAKNLEEDVKVVTEKLNNVKDFSGNIEDINLALQSFYDAVLKKLSELPQRSELDAIKTFYSSKLEEIQNSFTNLATFNKEALQSEISGNKDQTEKELKDMKKGFDDWKIETLQRFSQLGGGSQNQKIEINGTVMSKKYADFNFIGSITATDNNIKKRVDLNLSGLGPALPISLVNGGWGITNTRTDIATTGTINNQAVASVWLNYTGGSPVTLTGLDVTGLADGTEIIITNSLSDTNANFTLGNAATGSSPSNRFRFPSNVALRTGQSVRVRVNATANGWTLVGQAYSVQSPLLQTGTIFSIQQVSSSLNGYLTTSDYDTHILKGLNWQDGNPSISGVVPVGASSGIPGVYQNSGNYLRYNFSRGSLGINNNNAQGAVHAVGNYLLSVLPLISSGVSLDSAPNSSPSDMSSANTLQVNDGGGDTYTANGTMRSYAGYCWALSPSGYKYFSSSPYNYTFTDDNSSNTFYVQHYNMSGGTPNFRIIGAADGFSTTYYIDVTNDNHFDEHPSTWTLGNTITPNFYGYVSDGMILNIDYKIVPFKTSLGITYYGTPTIVSTIDPNDGLHYSTHISFFPDTSDGTMDGFKIQKQTNGGGYSQEIIVSGSTTDLYDDALQVWGAPTTITPTGLYIPAGVFEQYGTTIAEPAGIILKGVNDFMSVEFRDSTDTSRALVTVNNSGLLDIALTNFSINGNAGISTTITTAKLTALGSNGSMTFVKGILTASTPAT